MHPLLQRLIERARARRHRIVSPEVNDPRVIEAARRIYASGGEWGSLSR